MNVPSIPLNDREAQRTRNALEEVGELLSSSAHFQTIASGLPIAVSTGIRRSLETHRNSLLESLTAFENAKHGDFSSLKRLAGSDPGVALIIARLARGLSQKELARRLGLKEQQIQRYEAERYRSITLGNYKRVTRALGVQWTIDFRQDWPLIGSGWDFSQEIDAARLKKIIAHAKENNWFDDDEFAQEGELGGKIQRFFVDHISNFGSPTLLRSGINLRPVDDVLLVAWKARVSALASKIISKSAVSFSPLDLSWLKDIAKVSVHSRGVIEIRERLLERGIVLVIEPHIPGLKLDGAAFLSEGIPVIGMSLRRDTIDNFWFTLLHEIGHVVLHFNSGLRTGFFDDLEVTAEDELEKEADEFASNLLISDEIWSRAPARISKSAEVIERFAERIGVHPAIVYGRIQKERNDYATFAGKIGRGLVRQFLFSKEKS